MESWTRSTIGRGGRTQDPRAFPPVGLRERDGRVRKEVASFAAVLVLWAQATAAASPCCAVAPDGSSCAALEPGALAGCVEVDDQTCAAGQFLAGGGVPEGCVCSGGRCVGGGSINLTEEQCTEEAARACCAAGAGRGCADDSPVHESGTIVLSDGVELRYTVDRPGSGGPFPVALYLTPYSPENSVGAILDEFRALGYAVVSVSSRGTGCSGGQWDFFQPASDGYEVVEWAAAQEWSTGNVGMFGFSAPGITQILTAGTRPPSLKAIIPNEVTTDLYRDVGYPGGILNPGLVLTWPLVLRQERAAPGMAIGVTEGDAGCATRSATRPLPSDGRDAVEGLQRPYVDAWWHDHNPATVVPNIDVPVLTCQTWQDDQVTSRAGSSWLDDLDPEKTWAVFTNGPHGTCDGGPEFVALAARFFEHFVRGTPNGFDTEVPHVQIWHETKGASFTAPTWVTSHPVWPVEVEPVELYFRPGAVLDSDPPAGDDPDGEESYLYASPSSPNEATDLSEGRGRLWHVPPSPGTYVAFTSNQVAADFEIFGPGSVDLWFSSTAPDTDIQVTLTEVRPDGNEMYVQRGWLRASHRALDPERSTALRPFHTHLRQDAELLAPLEPVLLRVELNPVGHVFRKGSAIRIYVEAPAGPTGYYAFAFLPTPGRNTIHFGPEHPSRVVLGKVPGGEAQAPPPVCDPVLAGGELCVAGDPTGGCRQLVLSTPCRPDPIGETVPSAAE